MTDDAENTTPERLGRGLLAYEWYEAKDALRSAQIRFDVAEQRLRTYDRENRD